MQQFSKRTRDLLDKQVDERGYNGPAVVLAEGDRIAINNAMQFIERISNTLARHEEVEQHMKAAAEAQEAAAEDEGVLAVIQQQPQEKAVA